MAVFNVDLTSLDDVVKHINILKSHFGILKNNPNLRLELVDYSSLESLHNIKGSALAAIEKLTLTNKEISKTTWEIQQDILDIYLKIWNTDLTPLFNTLELDSTPKYYVYAHTKAGKLRTNSKAIGAFSQIHIGLKEKPFYIGKGTGNRYLLKERNEYYNKYRAQLASENIEVNHVIIKDKLSEYEALELESKLVDIYGIKAEGGFLLNLDSCYKPLLRRRMYPVECLSIFPKHIQNQIIAV
jgi:hypothetical protein